MGDAERLLISRLAFEEANRQLGTVVEQITEIRSRAISVLSATGLAAAVVGAVGVKPDAPGANWLFAIGLVALLATVMQVGLLLSPTQTWSLAFSAKLLLDNMTAGMYDDDDEAKIYERLALEVGDAASRNRTQFGTLFAGLSRVIGYASLAFLALLASVMASLAA